MTELPDPLRAAAARTPEAPAVISPARTLRYEELDRLVTTTAARLQQAGVEEGERVALYLPNTWQHLVLLMALLRAGSVACPLSTRTPTERVASRLSALSSRRLITNADVAATDATTYAPDQLLTASPLTDVSPPTFAPDQPVTAIFTSGSTGEPKAALHSFGNHYFSAAGSNENIPLVPGDRWLLSLPLYHVGGLAILFRCLLAGAAVVVPPPDAALADTLQRHRVTHVSMVATQLRRLLRNGAEPPPAQKALLLGGGPIPPALLDRAHERGWPVHTSYGLTEMSSQVTTTPPDASRSQLGTAGPVLPHRQLKIVDDEIRVKGRTLFLGYLEGDTLRRPVDEDGWLHTRDLGTLDAKGCLHVEGRKDHLFISGGENIQPEEIEAALRQLDGVEQAVVVPAPDDEFGQRPVAFVRTVSANASLEQLAARLEDHLPRFKIPSAFHPWPADQQTGRMKPDRAALRRRAVDLQRA